MGIFKKGTKPYGIFNYKCPRCHEGDLFKKPFDFGTAFKMKDACENCGQTYMPAPGFYYGSMFISYGLVGIFCFVFVGFAMFGLNMSVNAAFGLLIVVLLLLYVTIFRFSRSLWLNLMVKFNPKNMSVKK